MLELSRISNLFSKESTIKCQKCGYKISRPYPKDNLCPKCGTFVPAIFQINELEKGPELKPKEFETRSSSLSSKFQGRVRVKKETKKETSEGDKFIKLFGITSVNRNPLFCNNTNYSYLLELTNNLDFIATSILGGELDKMLLIQEDSEVTEKCQFYTKNGLIYLVYGKYDMLPDKKGKWLLEQIAKHYTEILKEEKVDDPDKIEKFEKNQIKKKFKRVLRYGILPEYKKLQDVFSDQDIPYVDDKIRVDYIGLSSQSIGIISLLVGDGLKVDVPGDFEDPEDLKEMKESTLTAKIEAIAANTLGNTNAVPRWIAVKLGYQNYRFLTFKEYDNDYFLYMLSEGNLEKINLVEKKIEPYLKDVIKNPFSGNLRPFNKLKSKLQGFFEKSNEFS